MIIAGMTREEMKRHFRNWDTNGDPTSGPYHPSKDVAIMVAGLIGLPHPDMWSDEVEKKIIRDAIDKLFDEAEQ